LAMMMVMGWDCVSELLPPTGLLFIRQVIYEHGELRCNDIEKGKLLIRPPDRCLAVLPTKPSSSKSGGTRRRKRWI
jgi:hypothetical protein